MAEASVLQYLRLLRLSSLFWYFLPVSLLVPPLNAVFGFSVRLMAKVNVVSPGLITMHSWFTWNTCFIYHWWNGLVVCWDGRDCWDRVS